MSLDIEGVLSAHEYRAPNVGVGPFCACGALAPSRPTSRAKHAVHVAAVLREQIEGALAEAEERGRTTRMDYAAVMGYELGWTEGLRAAADEWPEDGLTRAEAQRILTDRAAPAHLSDTERAGGAG